MLFLLLTFACLAVGKNEKERHLPICLSPHPQSEHLGPWAYPTLPGSRGAIASAAPSLTSAKSLQSLCRCGLSLGLTSKIFLQVIGERKFLGSAVVGAQEDTAELGSFGSASPDQSLSPLSPARLWDLCQAGLPTVHAVARWSFLLLESGRLSVEPKKC